MHLSIFRVLALLFGLIALTSSTVPASTTPKTKTTQKKRVVKKDRKTYRLKNKAQKQKKVKKQHGEKSIKTLTWLSVLSGIFSYGLAFASAWLWAMPVLSSILLVSSFLFTIATVCLGVMNIVKSRDRKLSTGDWILTILAFLISALLLSGFSASIVY